jgi:hypothetical protein
MPMIDMLAPLPEILNTWSGIQAMEAGLTFLSAESWPALGQESGGLE